MNKNLLALSLLLLGLTSCSSNNSTEESSSEVAVESEETVLEDGSAENSEEFVEESSSESVSEEEVMVESDSTAPSVSTDENTEMELDTDKTDSVSVEPEVSSTGTNAAAEVTETKISDDAKFAFYQVQKGDSLMLVSFKVYGDYRKWKKIYHLNEAALKNNTALSAGMNLKYQVPEEKFSWDPVGNPYLIKTDDTLGKISKEVYKKPMYWKYIYDNNRPLIRNPNLIFAGFTLYYKELTQEVINNYRSLSSKKK